MQSNTKLNIFRSACKPLTYCFMCFIVSAHAVCRPGWREYESKCYFFSTDTKTWSEANLFCQRQQTNLMSIQDIHERVRHYHRATNMP